MRDLGAQFSPIEALLLVFLKRGELPRNIKNQKHRKITKLFLIRPISMRNMVKSDKWLVNSVGASCSLF